jgi:thiamine transport system substrate-binding protein
VSADTVTLVTHDSFLVSKPVLRAFTQQTGITVKVLKSGDAGAALNQAILTKDHPLGDAFFGVDNTFLSRALDAGIFVPYTAKGLDTVPAAFQLDDKRRLTPIDYGDVCVNYDKAWFASKGVPVPQTLDDLRKPAYKGLLVVENPTTSSPGLVFMLATIAKFGVDGWQQYWKDLRANGVKVTDDWTQAYDSEFSAGSGHGQPLVVSYVEPAGRGVLRRSEARRPDRRAHRHVLPAGRGWPACCGAQHRRRPASSSTSCQREIQADIPLQMFVFPARPERRFPRLHQVRQGSRPTVHAPTGPYRRPARHLDQAMDHHRAAVTRVGRVAIVALPVAFLTVFFAWPVIAILERGLAPDGSLNLDPLGSVLTDPALRHVFWFTVWQAALSTVLTVLLALPGAFVLVATSSAVGPWCAPSRCRSC